MGDISWFQAAFIGLVEGLTEFLPISSTAHMEVVPQLCGMDDPGAAFSAVVQMGAGVAIIAYFFKDLVRYVQGILRTKSPKNVPPEDLDARLGWYTVFATIPALTLGYLLRKQIEGPFRSLYVIAGSMIVLALVLWVAEKVGKRQTPLDKLTLKESQVIGWAQVLALVPGVSRSGITMTAGLFQGLDRESATRFSFLLSVPIIMAAGLYELIKKVLPDPGIRHQAGPYLLGTLIAGLSAYAVIHWFLGYMRKHSTGIFIAYRIVLGIVLLILLQTGRLKPLHAEKPEEPKKTASVQTPHRRM